MGAPRTPPPVRALAVGLVAALLLPGCSLVSEPQERQLEGPTDGHQPTASYLKVFVRKDDGSLALLDFDRRDWYVAEIARQIDTRTVQYLGATVMPRNTLGEYLVLDVSTPAELDGLRYEAMEASPEARAEMDREYDEILRKLAEDALEKVPTPPTALLPEAALP